MPKLTIAGLKQEVDSKFDQVMLALRTLETLCSEAPASPATDYASGGESNTPRLAPGESKVNQFQLTAGKLYATFTKVDNHGKVIHGYMLWTDKFREAQRPPKGSNWVHGVKAIADYAEAEGFSEVAADVRTLAR